MPKFRAHVSIDSTSQAQAADLYSMSQAFSNKTVQVQWIETRESR